MIPVYISHPTPHTIQQKVFLRNIKDFFLKHNIMCDNVYVSDNSVLLQLIRERIKKCCGIVIVAYERKHIELATIKRGADIPGVSSQKVCDISETTPFTHIEMAMAYAYHLPVLVVKETGLLCEGVLVNSYLGVDSLIFDFDNVSFFDELDNNEAVKSFIEKVQGGEA